MRKIDGLGNVLSTQVWRIKPPVPVPPMFTKITGLTDEDLKDAPSFVKVLPEIQQYVLGVDRFVAHNVAYDVTVLRAELERIGMVTRFPWPPTHWCTVEHTVHLTGKHLKLTELYQHLFGEVPSQIHRAESDVELLTQCVQKLLAMGELWAPAKPVKKKKGTK